MHFSSRLKGLTKPKKVVKTYAKTLKKGIKTKKKDIHLNFYRLIVTKELSVMIMSMTEQRTLIVTLFLGKSPIVLQIKLQHLMIQKI